MTSQKRRVLAWIGGAVACVVLIGTGIAYIVIGLQGRDEVHDTISRENIVGTPDMKPGGITADVGEPLPTCDVADVKITNGDQAKCFASYMRVHTLESTDGQTYAEIGRYLDPEGQPTSDEAEAAKTPSGRPVENPLRQLWVTETSLTTGLNMSFFAEQVSLFAVVMGGCLLVIGIGLGVLTVFMFGAAPWREAPAPAPGDGEPTP
jgi:hypothetical protein